MTFREVGSELQLIYFLASFPDLKIYRIDKLPRSDELLPLVWHGIQNVTFLEFNIARLATCLYKTQICVVESGKSKKPRGQSKKSPCKVPIAEKRSQLQVKTQLENMFESSIPLLQGLKNLRALKRLHITVFGYARGGPVFVISSILMMFQTYMDANGLASVADISDDTAFEEAARKMATEILDFCEVDETSRIAQSPDSVVAIDKSLLWVFQLPDSDSTPTPDLLARMLVTVFEVAPATPESNYDDEYCGPCASCKTEVMERLAQAALCEILFRVIEAHK